MPRLLHHLRRMRTRCRKLDPPSKPGTSLAIMMVARGPPSTSLELSVQPRSTLSSVISRVGATRRNGSVASCRSIFTLSKSKVMMGTRAVSMALRFSTRRSASSRTLRLVKKSSMVTEEGATQMTSMSAPGSSIASLKEPDVCSSPPACAASSSLHPFPRHVSRTHSRKMYVSWKTSLRRRSDSSAVSTSMLSPRQRASVASAAAAKSRRHSALRSSTG
mmetsp:Transcript_21008/g.63991  ORF Transcript_21008/g.63991 Transcript_21008/m.63991 type:complete len:219 (-) Transcript_21008:137-793(-)